MGDRHEEQVVAGGNRARSRGGGIAGVEGVEGERIFKGGGRDGCVMVEGVGWLREKPFSYPGGFGGHAETAE